LVRDWGIVDLMLLTGFRERTYPGQNGRFRGPVVEVDDAEYESGAGRHRVGGVARWSHHLGPLSLGIYQFSGTGRDPAFRPALAGSELVLVPQYRVIDQTGVNAQALFGDWVWKLEAISRHESGRRFYAYNAGFERTAVGVFGTQSDLGLVADYMYDERGEAADSLFEHDAGFGVRWRANDIADTTALVAVILDVESDEYVVSLEASRRLGASWLGTLEARVFGGVEPPVPGAGFSDADLKSRALQSDDYVQLELTRYF
jgi:hypothetical protein